VGKALLQIWLLVDVKIQNIGDLERISHDHD
jgi:hypothetical protein